MIRNQFKRSLGLFGLCLLAACGGGGSSGGGGDGSNNTAVIALLSIAVSPANPEPRVGNTQQLMATGTYSDGSARDITGTAAWSSSNTTIAGVDASGLVTAGNAGAATISASLSGISGDTTVTVQGAVNLARTGQSTSYVADDDGATQVGVAWPGPRFVIDDCGTPGVNGDDVVTDQLTGLTWVRDHGGATTRTWQQSLDYANALSFCGFDDWRLANVNELESLVNAGESGFTWLAAQGFLMSQSAFWASTTNALHPDRAWSVDVFGSVSEYPKTTTTAAWAVRGPGSASVVTLARSGQATCYDTGGLTLPSCAGSGQDGELQAGTPWPSSRFRTDDCGTPATDDDVVTDNLTGLSWLRDANRFGLRAWADAVADAAGLSLCGHGDWRLPNQRELRSLVNYETAPGNWLAQTFDNLEAANAIPCYWTSTSAPFDSVNRAACGFLFSGIFSVLEAKTAQHYVWPVRGGLSTQ